jgi:hypothetical protein
MMKTEIAVGAMFEVRNGVSIQSERCSPIGVVQIARYTLWESADVLVPGGDSYQLNMAMALRRPERAATIPALEFRPL